MIKKLETAGIRRLIAIGFCAVLAIVPVRAAGAAIDPTAIQRIPMAIPEIGVLNVNGNTGKVFVNLCGSITERGKEIILDGPYVQYSMIVPKDQRRVLTARLEGTGFLPPGCSLRLRAVASGKKNEGASPGPIVLTADPQAILCEIGSCATGSGATDGARLVFTLTGPQLEKTISGEMRTATIILAFN